MDKISYFIVMIIAVIILAASIMTCSDCHEKGGVLVRGAFWYKCLEETK